MHILHSERGFHPSWVRCLRVVSWGLAAALICMVESVSAGVAVTGVRSVVKAASAVEQEAKVRSKVFEEGAEVSDVIFLEAPKADEFEGLDPEPEEKGALRIGIVRPLAEPYSLVAAKKPKWSRMRDASRVWAVIVQSEGAEGVRINLDNVHLPKGARLIATSLANPDESVGPYDLKDALASENFWTETIFADAVVLECQVDATADEEDVSFDIVRVAHMYVPLSKLFPQPKVGNCHNDVTCANADWRTAGNGVAGIGTIGDAGFLWCTGTLLNNTGEDEIDYFLTANHCVKNQSEADSTEYYWFYQTSTCNGSAPNPSSVPRTGGGAVYLAGRSRSTGSDFALLRLRNSTPDGVTYVGWTADSPGSSASVRGIHHPDGSYKRISYGTITGQPGNYWRVGWSSGVTEPGSSGSPLFNSSRQVIGQLYGGLSSCQYQSGPDEYGRFGVTLPYVTQWLQPGSSGQPNDNFSDATVIAGSSGQVNGGNVAATKETGEPNHAGNSGGKSVWWRWTAPADGEISINTFGSNFDTLLAAYTGSEVDNLTVVSSNDDSGGGLQSRITFDAVEGVVYRVAVDGYNGASGDIVLNWTSAGSPGVVTRINAGGGAQVSWEADRGYLSGSGKYKVGRTIAMAGDLPQKVLRCIRYTFAPKVLNYNFPEFPAGNYTVRLHFADIYSTSAGTVKFHVHIEGKRVLKKYDVFAAAGGRDRRIMKEFQTVVDDNGLQLRFTPVVGGAFINAIEIEASGNSGLSAYGLKQALDVTKPLPANIWTSGNQGSEQGGWNAVDGDFSTAWIGDAGADSWWLALGYGQVTPVKDVRVFHAANSVTNVTFIGSLDGRKWFSLEDAFSRDGAILRYLWMHFMRDGKDDQRVPNILEIEVDQGDL